MRGKLPTSCPAIRNGSCSSSTKIRAWGCQVRTIASQKDTVARNKLECPQASIQICPYVAAVHGAFGTPTERSCNLPISTKAPSHGIHFAQGARGVPQPFIFVCMSRMLPPDNDLKQGGFRKTGIRHSMKDGPRRLAERPHKGAR